MSGPSAPAASSNLPSAYMYQPTWQSGADTMFQSSVQNPQLSSGYANYLTAAQNDPYASAYQAAAGNAGTAASGAGGQLMTSANSVLNTAFDPQSALYNQQYQQQQDQTNAALAQSGLAGSGAGAGIAATNDQNFNINWQNQQLSRQLQGLSAYNTASTSGINDTLLGGQLPYSAYNANNANVGSALGNYNAYNQNTIGDLMQYMGLGSSSAEGLMAAQNATYADQVQQQQNMLGGLGSLAGLGASSFGANGMFGSGGAFPGLFSGGSAAGGGTAAISASGSALSDEEVASLAAMTMM